MTLIIKRELNRKLVGLFFIDALATCNGKKANRKSGINRV
jgi:hypothetical protein